MKLGSILNVTFETVALGIFNCLFYTQVFLRSEDRSYSLNHRIKAFFTSASCISIQWELS